MGTCVAMVKETPNRLTDFPAKSSPRGGSLPLIPPDMLPAFSLIRNTHQEVKDRITHEC